MNAMRELGEGVPVSIGTALALESVFGDGQSEKPPIKSIKEFWFNVRTLIRNILGAYTTEERKLITAQQLYMDLYSELQIIDASVQRYSSNQCKAVFYVCTHQSLARKFPHAVLKQLKSEQQLYMRALEENAIKLLAPNVQLFNWRVFDTELDGRHPTAFIMTHYAIDLLSKSYFERLALIESHTGTIKPPMLWHTKLTNGNDLPQMPFNRFTLQIFGDRSICFNAMPGKMREYVITMSRENKWTPATTKDKILYAIKALRDPVAIPFLLDLW